MQERRNKILLIILLLLIAATATVLFIQAEGDGIFEGKDLFKVEDLKSIDRIELTSQNDTIHFIFSGTRWMVNDRIADRDMIDVLFATLLQAEAKRPVAEIRNDSIYQAMKTSGVRVKLFEKEQEKKSFIASGNARKSEAYFADDSGNVYVMNIPGYRVYVSGIFELKETEWLDKYVFAFNWTNFKNLSTEFATSPNNNFLIEMQNGYFGIKSLETDTAKLNDLLDAVSLLTVDQYTNGDSLLAKQPLVKITVKDIADRTYMLSIYNISKDGKIACLVKDSLPAWIDNRKLTRILKNREFFIKKP